MGPLKGPLIIFFLRLENYHTNEENRGEPSPSDTPFFILVGSTGQILVDSLGNQKDVTQKTLRQGSSSTINLFWGSICDL